MQHGDSAISAKPYPRAREHMGETGTVQLSSTAPQMVQIFGDYRQPVVFCGVPTQRGADPVNCRVTGLGYRPGTQYVYADEEGAQASTEPQEAWQCGDGAAAWCFWIMLQEPTCLDQWHADEVVSWFVMERGAWLSDDGKQIQAGVTTAGSSGWREVNYLGTGFANNPITITQIQSIHGAFCSNENVEGVAGAGDVTAATSPEGACSGFGGIQDILNFDNDVPNVPTGYTHTRQRKHSSGASGQGAMQSGSAAARSGQLRQDTMHFFVTLESESRLHLQSGSMEGHIQEDVAWAAFDVGHSSLGAVVYEAGRTPMAVTHNPYEIKFSGFFRYPPNFFANLASYHGDDSAQIRLVGRCRTSQSRTAEACDEEAITSAGVTVEIEEELCSGAGGEQINGWHSPTEPGQSGYGFGGDDGQGNTGHGNAEEVDYFAINAGRGPGMLRNTEFRSARASEEQEVSTADAFTRGGMQASRIIGIGDLGTEQGHPHHAPFAEFGDITLMWTWENNWETVALKHYYLKPVIIVGSPTTGGKQAITTRIRNLRHGQGCDGWCFDICIQEPPCMDGAHPAPETVHYMVVESGSWSSDEGTMLQAGVNEIDGDMRLTGRQFQAIRFLGSGFPGGQLPVVLTQVMSYYGSNFVK